MGASSSKGYSSLVKLTQGYTILNARSNLLRGRMIQGTCTYKVLCIVTNCNNYNNHSLEKTREYSSKLLYMGVN